MQISKLLFELFVFVAGTIAFISARNKLRDGTAPPRFGNFVSERHGADRLGFWLSVSVDMLLGAAAIVFAVAIALGRIPITFGRS